MRGDNYLTEEYEANVYKLADSCPEYREEEIREKFVKECQRFDETFDQETPLSAVRRLAWRQTKHKVERTVVHQDEELFG